MINKTIFEQIDCQNKIWKTGLYNYLYDNVFSIRFHICDFFVRKYINGPADVLDVGAGSGSLFVFICNIVKKYDYNDIAEEAVKVFKNSDEYKSYQSRINILYGDINKMTLYKRYDIITSLGVAKYVYKQDLFFDLFYNNLADGGIMILETTESCDAISYYCCELPKPIHSFKFEILDDFDFNTSKIRIINVYRKPLMSEVNSNA